MADTSLQLKIYRLSAALQRPVRQFGDETKRSVLGEQIYCWTTQEDVYKGIGDAERADIQREIAAFDGSESSSSFSFSKLQSLTEKLEALGADENWVPALFIRTSEVAPFGEETRLPPTLAFAHHLRWICETFGKTPNLAVVFE